MKRLFLKVLGLTLAGALVSACGGNDSSDDQTPGTMLAVAQRGGFSGLALAAQKAGLTATLTDPNANVTLLAPSNDAFGLLANQLGFRTIAEMIDNLPPAALESIMRYHVLPSRLTAADLVAGGPSQPTLLTQGGSVVPLALSIGGGASVDVRVTDRIGRVAFVGITDVPNDNGVLHVIDRVLLPQSVLSVLQTIRSAPERFGAFSSSASSSVMTALSGPAVTLFAPSNDAFMAADVTALLPTLAANQISALLEYHIVTSNLPSSAFVLGAPVTTLLGQTFTINSSGGLMITDTTATAARIEEADILATNGVVHALDKVLRPALPAP